jgi:DNA-binding CsgD family transcriptional regulator
MGKSATALTPRELEVLIWIAEALTDSQIAAQMGTKIGTVKRHAANVRDKIGADNRVAMAMYAVRKGLFKP